MHRRIIRASRFRPRLVLKPGRDKSLRHRHPWIFSGAIERVEGEPATGDTVAVVAPDGAFLAWAAYSPQSQIRARVWSFEPRTMRSTRRSCAQRLAAVHRAARD